MVTFIQTLDTRNLGPISTNNCGQPEWVILSDLSLCYIYFGAVVTILKVLTNI